MPGNGAGLYLNTNLESECTAMISVRRYRLELTMLRDVLGGSSLNPTIYQTYLWPRNDGSNNVDLNSEIAHLRITAKWVRKQEAKRLIKERDPKGTKKLKKKEVAAEVEELVNRSTGFFRIDDTGHPHIPCWVIKGILKESCGHLRRDKGTKSAKLRCYKSVINGDILIDEDFIPLELAGPLTWIERQMRGWTPQGERTALVRSEVAPAGSKVTLHLAVTGTSVTLDMLREWLDRGQITGMGQWRSAGWGRFVYALTPVDFDDNPTGETMTSHPIKDWTLLQDDMVEDPKPARPTRKAQQRITLFDETDEESNGHNGGKTEPEIVIIPAITPEQAQQLRRSVRRAGPKSAITEVIEYQE